MSSDSEIAVRVCGVSKAYTIAQRANRHSTLVESLLDRARHPFAHTPKKTFWALRDLEFSINKGEVVGIVGHNGAGKSTLLKILSRITEPTKGTIELYGRVGSLLEVGTGFHPELTGRENVFLNGAILGMTKAEIRKQFDAIVDFAGVEQFLDTPVKRYSSGMYVRLAFAIAAHLHSDILIVDEVLAVGDAAFQEKCTRRIGELSAEQSRTILLVSHNNYAITSLCKSAIWLHNGRCKGIGRAAEIIRDYLAHGQSEQLEYCPKRDSDGPTSAWVTKCMLVNADGNAAIRFGTLEPIDVVTSVALGHDAIDLEYTIVVNRRNGGALFASSFSDFSGRLFQPSAGSAVFRLQIPAQFIAPGDYSLTLILHRPMVEIYDRHEAVCAFSVDETGSRIAKYGRSDLGDVLVAFPWRLDVASGEEEHQT